MLALESFLSESLKARRKHFVLFRWLFNLLLRPDEAADAFLVLLRHLELSVDLHIDKHIDSFMFDQ